MDRTIIQFGATGPVATFQSTYLAQQATGVNQSNISKCLKGKLKTAGGYRWRYDDGDDPTAAQQQKKEFWLWSFIKLEDQLAEIIVADYSANRKRKRSFDQIHHLLPKYLYFPHQLIEAKDYTKVIHSHTYAEITADSPTNFQKVVNAWKQLGVVEITRDNIETIDEEGKKSFTTREYRLTPAFQNGFKKQRFFDASYGTMITDLIAYNHGGGENNARRKRRSRKKQEGQHPDRTSAVRNQLVMPSNQPFPEEMVAKKPAVPEMTRKTAFHNIRYVLGDSDESLFRLSDAVAERAIKEELEMHPMAQKHMDALLYWLPAYLDTEFLPAKRRYEEEPETEPEPSTTPPPPQIRKRISNEEWEMRTLRRLVKKEEEKEAADTEYITMSFGAFDL